MYSRLVSSFCVELASCRVGGCRVGLHPNMSSGKKVYNWKVKWRETKLE